MKTQSIALVALASSAQLASATFGWLDAKKFTCPSNTNNVCIEPQKGGYDWSGLNLGSFTGYGGLDFKGFECASTFDGNTKRDLITGRTFQNKCIKGKATYEKATSPSFGCGSSKDVEKFSVSEFQISVEFDVDLEFHYDMPDGSTCKQKSSCKKSGTLVKNTQCGGAKNVQVILPPKYSGGGKSSCDVGFHHIGFDCSPPVSTKTVPAYTPPASTTPVYTPPVYTPPAATTKSTTAAVTTSSTTGAVTTSSTTAAVTTSSTTPAGSSTTPAQSTTTPAATTSSTTSAYTPPAGESTTVVPPFPVNGTTSASSSTTPASSSTTSAGGVTSSTPGQGPSTTPQGPYETPSTTGPQPPATTAPCPPVLPQCLNTWLFSSGCKSNTDKDCFCSSSEYVDNIYQCLAAYGASDEEVDAAQSYFQGICAVYIPSNPAIVTGVNTLTITSTAGITVPVTTVQLITTVVVPCTQTEGPSAGSPIPGSSTTTTISTALTVPQVVFQTVPGASTPAVSLVQGTAPAVITNPAAPAATKTTLTSVRGPTGTASPTPIAFTGASSKTVASFGTLFAASLMAFLIM